MYFQNILDFPCETVNAMCHAVEDPKFGNVDFIVGTGIGGILTLVPVSIKLGIPFIAVRKEVDAKNVCEGGSHSSSTIETTLTPTWVSRGGSYVIVDDFIDSGKTVELIQKLMTNRYRHSQCAGIVLYQDYSRLKFKEIPVTCLCDDIIELNNMKLGEGVLV